MNATQQLHDLGQRLWLDNITRALLADGTLSRYIREFAVTGLTSNPTIFDQAIRSAGVYDEAVRRKAAQGKSGEALFFELALEDLTQAADLFRPIHDATGGVDGWVSLEVSPLLADDTAGSKDPNASDTLYIEALAAPDTINTMPEKTLQAFADHGALAGPMNVDSGDAEAVLAGFAQAGIDIDALAIRLQHDGARGFVNSWSGLLQRIAEKSAAPAGAGKEPA